MSISKSIAPLLEALSAHILTKHIPSVQAAISKDSASIVAQYTGVVPGIRFFTLRKEVHQFLSLSRFGKKGERLSQLAHNATANEHLALMRLLTYAGKNIPLENCTKKVLAEFKKTLPKTSAIRKFLLELDSPPSTVTMGLRNTS